MAVTIVPVLSSGRQEALKMISIGTAIEIPLRHGAYPRLHLIITTEFLDSKEK